MYTKTYERLNECTVLMNPALLDLCKTHKGCPRGPMGVPMVLKQEKDDFASRIKDALLMNGKYILKGSEEDFVCVPRIQYEEILRILSEMK